MQRHFDRGMALFGLQRYLEAVEEFTLALGDDPQDADILAMRAAALCNADYPRSALTDVQTAIGFEPTNAFAFYVLSCIEQRRGNLEAAEDAILESLRIYPSSTWFGQLGEIQYQRNRLQDCLVATERALELNPWNEQSLILRANAMSRLGRSKEAETLLRSSLRDNPDSPASHHAMGLFSLNVNRPAESLEFLRESRRMDPVGFNDPAAIAFAYGRLQFPFFLINRLVVPWYNWTPKTKWAIYTVLGCLALGNAYALMNESWRTVRVTLPAYLVIINVLMFSFTYRNFATLAGFGEIARGMEHSGAKALGMAYTVFRAALIAHVIGSGMLAFVAVLPPLVYLIYGGVVLTPFVVDFLGIATYRRGFAYLIVGILLLVPALAGAVTSLESLRIGLVMWVILIATAFFSTDISHWIMRPRGLKVALRTASS